MQGAQRLYPELGPYLDYSVMSVSEYLVCRQCRCSKRIIHVFFIKDNSVGSEPDVDQLSQWGKFVYDDEIKQASVILLRDSVRRVIVLSILLIV